MRPCRDCQFETPGQTSQSDPGFKVDSVLFVAVPKKKGEPWVRQLQTRWFWLHSARTVVGGLSFLALAAYYVKWWRGWLSSLCVCACYFILRFRRGSMLCSEINVLDLTRVELVPIKILFLLFLLVTSLIRPLFLVFPFNFILRLDFWLSANEMLTSRHRMLCTYLKLDHIQ